MKQLAIITFLILISLASCQKIKNEVLIKGRFMSEIPDSLKYTVPVNGICYEFFNKKSEIDSLGNFEFRFNIEKPCFVALLLPGTRGQLIAEPGESYFITIDTSKNQNQFRFECKNSGIQYDYQQLISPLHPQFEAMKILDSPISVAKNKIDSIYDKEVLLFKELFDKDEISIELFDLIKLDRTLFYSSVQGQVAMLRFVDIKRQNPEANTDSINKFWNESVLSVPLNNINILNSKWAYYYLQNYLLFKEYTSKDFNWNIRSNARKNGLFHTYLIDIASKYFDGEILEFYVSSYILTMARQEKYENELITLFDKFKGDYPASKYTQYIVPNIDKIINFQISTNLKYDEETKFLNNYENFKTLAESVEQFKGKKVYIDIWATWCGYCKDEFIYNKELKTLLNSKNIELLYISADRDEDTTRWKNMIKYYNLTGNHMRASNELITDLNSLMGNFGIPRYILIDEYGNIKNNDAKRPSEIKELEKQINEK